MVVFNIYFIEGIIIEVPDSYDGWSSCGFVVEYFMLIMLIIVAFLSFVFFGLRFSQRFFLIVLYTDIFNIFLFLCLFFIMRIFEVIGPER